MRALVLVDVQNDFMPGGALPVPDGFAVIPAIHALLAAGHDGAPFDRVVATQDWHPADHASFAIHHPGRSPGEVVDLDRLPQVLWPVHCVAGTPGADFVPTLDARRVEAVFRKGTDPRVDSYSGLWDNGHRRSTGLADWLRGVGITEVHVVGVATDYCVAATARDAHDAGFAVTVHRDACRAVDLRPGDGERALADLAAAGVRIV